MMRSIRIAQAYSNAPRVCTRGKEKKKLATNTLASDCQDAGLRLCRSSSHLEDLGSMFGEHWQILASMTDLVSAEGVAIAPRAGDAEWCWGRGAID